MLAVHQRRQDPGHLWQLARRAVGQEVVGEARAEGLCSQLRVFFVGFEVVQHAVAGVAVGRGVDLPADPRVLELLGVGPPRERAEVLVAIGDLSLQGRSRRGVEIDGRAHRVQAIGIGLADHRAEVAVADRERVGKRVEEGQVLARVVAHRVVPVLGVRFEMGRDEPVQGAVVPGFVHRLPVVGDVVDALAAFFGVEVEGQQMAAVRFARFPRQRLVEDAFPAAIVEWQGLAVEAFDAAVGAEVAVERAVLVDEDHDVLDVGQRPARRGSREHLVEHARRSRERLKTGEHARRRPRAQKIPAS